MANKTKGGKLSPYELRKKFTIHFMENGGDMNNAVNQATPILQAIGPEAAALLPVVTTTVSGIQDSIARTKKVNAMEGLAGMKEDTNPFMMRGGKLKKFFGPKHENGGIPINQNMMVDPMNPDAEVEGGETGVQLEDGGYIFSDKLGMDGMTFADKSKMIDSKFKREDDITKRTKQVSLEKLSKANDFAKSMMQEAEQFAMGGKLKKYFGGGPFPYAGMSALSNEVNNAFDAEEAKMHGASLYRGTAYTTPYDVSKDPTGPEIISPVSTPPKLRTSTPGAISPISTTSVSSMTATDPMADLLSGPDLAAPAKREPFNFNNVALGLKGAALARSIYDSFQPAEQEKLRLNPNAGEVESIMEGLNINLQPAFNEIDFGVNQSIQGARNVAGSAITQQVLANSAINKANRAKANLVIDEQQANNQLRASEAAVKSKLGTEERAYRRETDVSQMQNDATKRGFERDLYSNLSQIGSQFNKYQYTQEQAANAKEIAQLTIAEGTKLLANKYPDFTITDNIVEELKKGLADGSITDINGFIKYRAAKK